MTNFFISSIGVKLFPAFFGKAMQPSS